MYIELIKLSRFKIIENYYGLRENKEYNMIGLYQLLGNPIT
jgi:hypothetical protein